MNDETSRTLGRHDAEIEQLQRDMQQLKDDVRAIREILAQARGGWRTLMLVAGIAGALGAAAQKLFALFGGVIK